MLLSRFAWDFADVGREVGIEVLEDLGVAWVRQCGCTVAGDKIVLESLGWGEGLCGRGIGD